MTQWQGNTPRYTDPLCRESIGGFPHKRPVMQSFDIFVNGSPEEIILQTA